jgi:hypothetical protein
MDDPKFAGATTIEPTVFPMVGPPGSVMSFTIMGGRAAIAPECRSSVLEI